MHNLLLYFPQNIACLIILYFSVQIVRFSQTMHQNLNNHRSGTKINVKTEGLHYKYYALKG